MSTNGKRKRRTFSEEFKRDAVNLVVVEGYTIAAAARAVNVLDGSLREWYRKYAPQYPTPRAINGEAGIKNTPTDNNHDQKMPGTNIESMAINHLAEGPGSQLGRAGIYNPYPKWANCEFRAFLQKSRSHLEASKVPSMTKPSTEEPSMTIQT